MVVVEGVARSLDPNVNIWQVARPIVEGYIKQNIGPRALLRDLGRTARVLARFGPKLPRLVEDRLFRAEGNPAPRARSGGAVLWFLAGAVVALAGVGIGLAF